MFKQKRLKEIPHPDRKEVTEDSRKFHNDESHNVCCSPNGGK